MKYCVGCGTVADIRSDDGQPRCIPCDVIEIEGLPPELLEEYMKQDPDLN
jgi:hypothetical protein